MAEVFNLPTKEQFDTMNSHLGDIAAPDAVNVKITDTGNHYTSTNVEGALQEVGEQINSFVADNAKYAEYYLSANQSVSNSTITTLSFGQKSTINNEDFTILENGQIKILTTGVYIVNFCVLFGANATGSRSIFVKLPARLTYRKGNHIVAATSNAIGLSINLIAQLNSGELIGGEVRQTSGGALDVSSDTRYTYLQIKKVG